jgi:hypothetical protein
MREMRFEMERKKGFEFHVDEFVGYNWVFVEDEKGDLINASEEPKVAAKLVKVSPEFMELFASVMTDMANEIIEALKADLEDMHDDLE